MNRIFEKVNGEKILDVKKYIKEYVDEYPNVKLRIGTDSQEKGGKTTFATVIAFEHPRNGVHVISTQFKHNGLLDLMSKMLKEVSCTKDVADFLEVELRDLKISKNINVNENIFTLHTDVNPDDRWDSNIAYNSIVGWLRGCGYDVETKPDAWAASKAADAICKGKFKIGNN